MDEQNQQPVQPEPLASQGEALQGPSSQPPQQPPLPPQNVNPVPPPQHKNWIKWVLIIVFVALLASITTYFVLNSQTQKPPPPQIVQTTPSPTPDLYTEGTRSATANWNVYINDRYKYSVRYPAFITFKTEGDDVIFYYKKDALETRPSHELPAYYTNGLSFYFRSGSPREAASLELPGRPLQEVQINNIKGVKIADSDFDYYLASKSGNSSIRTLYLPPKAYQTEEEIKERLKIYEQILSTFRFTD